MTEVEMEYQKNLKYFKSTDTHYYIGLPMFIIGAAHCFCAASKALF